MKRTSSAAALLACALCVSSTAQAAPLVAGSTVDLAGFLQANGALTLNNATSLDFVSGPGASASVGAAGIVPSYGSGTGSLAGFNCMTGLCGAIADIANLSVGAQSIPNFFTLTGGSNSTPISFDLTSINAINRGDPNFLTFSATGTLKYAAFFPTTALFLFSSQGGTATSFSASATALASPVPEPASWAVMLLGFAGVGQALRRRPKLRARVRFG